MKRKITKSLFTLMLAFIGWSNIATAQWSAVNNGLTTTNFISLVTNGTSIFAGAAGPDGVFRSTDNGGSWTTVSTGITGYNINALAISGTNIFAGNAYGASGVFLSTNNGDSWTMMNSGLTNTSVYSLAVSGTNIFAGTADGVFLSTNNGGLWTFVSSSFPANTTVRKLEVIDANIFAGTSKGVFLSTNNGGSWVAVNSGLPSINISTLAVSGSTIYAGIFTKGVYLSTNNGGSWTLVNNTLAANVLSIAASGSNIFVGNYDGVVLSTDNGNSFTQMTGLPPASDQNNVNSFVINGSNIFAATNNAGVFINTISTTLSSAKDISAFSFINPTATGTISGTNISLCVPTGTDVANLVASFNNSSLSNVKVGAVAQVSGNTPNDFTNPVNYTVTAEDGSIQNYTVTVTICPVLSSAKDITAFSFTSPAATGTITGNDIAVTVPNGINLTNLIASFNNSLLSSVKIGATSQVSGTTVNDFTNPVTYIVTAEDGSTKNYIVTATIAPALSSAKDITAFSFTSPAVTGAITGNNISLCVPTGTNLTNLVASYSNSALSTVKIGTTAQVNGTTANNFTNPLVYTVTAEDGSTKNYTVTVTICSVLSSAKDISKFDFIGLTPAVIGVFSSTSITLTVPYNINLTNLVASFTISALSTVKIGTATQISGTTPNDFTSPVIYTVTAQDGSTKNYTITVIKATVTGINQLSNNKLLINPNPSTGIINLNLANNASEATQLRITDILGKVVYSENLLAGTLERQMNLQGYPDGIYFLQMQSGKNTETKKLILKK